MTTKKEANIRAARAHYGAVGGAAPPEIAPRRPAGNLVDLESEISPFVSSTLVNIEHAVMHPRGAGSFAVLSFS